jgi:hypothetical protein
MSPAKEMSCHDKSPMNYQERLFFAVLVLMLAIAAACFVGLTVTACHDSRHKVPDIIATQPKLK